MKFSIISDAFEEMEGTTKRLELRDILAKLFTVIPKDVIRNSVYLLQGKLRPDFEGIELGIAEKLAIKAISKSTGLTIKKIEDDYRDCGDLGITTEKMLKLKTQTTFKAESITLERVYDTLLKISTLEGKGSQDLKIKYISSLLNDATPIEGKFLLKMLLGTLRLGIAENTIIDALAKAFTPDKDYATGIRRAYNVSSDLGLVSEVLANDGWNAVKQLKVSLFRPIRPMLANRVKPDNDELGNPTYITNDTRKKLENTFAAEYKLDGERAQIHKENDKIMIFSRSLENITEYYPDIVEKIVKSIDSKTGIFEAEIVAINENTGEFLPFQELMHRRRKYGIKKAVSEYPITVNFFDVLFIDNQDYTIGARTTALEYSERRKILEKVVLENDFAKLIPMITATSDDIPDFLENSINSGCEGLMLKRLDSFYSAGSRGDNWLKLKREYRNELGDSLDLVVIGAFFGKGRRTGRYGTLLLASYNDDEDAFESICKVGTGFTDENLDQMYQILSNKVILKKNTRVNSQMEADIWFEPELVIEIVASEITLSPIHKTALNSIRDGSGLALRFPKFTGKIRHEKNAEDASTGDEVIALYKSQNKVNTSQSENMY